MCIKRSYNIEEIHSSAGRRNKRCVRQLGVMIVLTKSLTNYVKRCGSSVRTKALRYYVIIKSHIEIQEKLRTYMLLIG